MSAALILPQETQSWTRNLHTSRPAYFDSSNQPAERDRLDESKGGSQKAPNQTQSDSLEKESSTFSHFESVRDEMAKEGKHADEPDTQPGYWETSSHDKEADNSRGESGISGTEPQKKLKEKRGGVASDKKGVTSEAEEELRSGPAKSEYQ